MDFEKTIEFLEFLKEVNFAYGGKSYDMEKNINDVIQSFKRGEKYEAMWGELRDKNMCMSRPDGRYIDDEDFEELEQKYFPKKEGD